MDLRELRFTASKVMQEAAEQFVAISDMVYDSITQAQNDLVNQLDIESFTANIMSMPEKIRVQQEVLKEARTAFEAAKSDLVNAESMLMAVITAETNEAGKPRFSNDGARRAELEIRKKLDYDYMSAWDPYKTALDDMENAQFKLEQLQNEFKAYQVVGGLLAARMGLMRLEV